VLDVRGRLGTAVAPGDSRVELVFAPHGQRALLALSFTALAALLWLARREARRSDSRPAARQGSEQA
jgi:hypothetical protein